MVIPMSAVGGEKGKIPKGIEFSEIVLDETITRFGQEFYEYFNSFWQPLGQDVTIKITERPGPQQTLVVVTVNETVLYMRRISPRSLDIEESAKEAVDRVQLYVLENINALDDLELY
jgi:hypothetical protein